MVNTSDLRNRLLIGKCTGWKTIFFTVLLYAAQAQNLTTLGGFFRAKHLDAGRAQEKTGFLGPSPR